MSKLEELKKFLADNKDDKEVTEYISGLSAVTADKVSAYLQTEEGKKYHQPILDSYFTKAHKSWEEKNLEKIKADAVAASKEETPEAKKLRELESDLANEKKARLKESFKNRAIKELQAKGLSVELVDYVSAGETEEDIVTNISNMEKIFKGYSDKLNADFQSKNGRQPILPGQTKLTKEILKTLTPEQIAQYPQEEVDAVLAQG